MSVPDKQKKIDDQYGVTRVPGRCGGRPCVGNTRLTCSSVLAFVVQGHGDTYAAIQAYPHLEIGEIDAIVAWGLQTPMRWRR